MASNKIDRDALRQKILSVEGLDNETRTQMLGLLSEKKRYGLVWEEKPEDVEEQLRENLPVLKEVEERRILSDDAESPNHILIEGDNLHALTALTYTHEGKVDVIYIDPPYNTGNKDFIYNDCFVDAEDGYRHSKWLSFMSKRLRIAKKLLSDKGVIFISIDDNEQANLKLLCDEVFGNNHYITSIPRITKKQRAAQEKHMDISHDYVVCYAYSEDFAHIIKRQIDETKIKKDSVGTYIEGDTKAILADKSKGYSVGGDYDFEYNGKIYKPVDKNGIRNRWLWTKKRMEAAANLGILVETNNSLRMQLYLDKKFDETTNSMVERSSDLIFHTSDFMTDNFYTNSVGSTELKGISLDMFTAFNNPKPLRLIISLISLSLNKSSLILDFFAGSGTTLHATMQLNAEDGGKRQCILVTNNENKICEEVTYERNKRVINGYTTPKGEQVEGLKSNNLRYYKVDFVERDSSMTAKKKLMEASTELLCIKQDLYEEKQTFGSIKLNPRYARYFDDGKKQMLIIYNIDAIESLVGEIEKMPADINIMTYVFSTNNYALDADFEVVADKVTLCALPAAIYNAYLNVLPKKVTPKTEEDETETIPGE